MLAIDHFTELNNTRGSLFTDFVLKKLNELIIKQLRAADSVYRYGKEEFIVILPETALKGTKVAAQRLLQAVRPMFTINHSKQRPPITQNKGLDIK